MATNELEYLPPVDFDVAMVGSHLPEPLHTDGHQSETQRRAFYDTFDCRLRDAGLRLVHVDGLLRLTGESRELATPADTAPDTISPAELEPGPLRDRLTDVCGVRVLLRTARIDTNGTLIPVLDEESKTVARLLVERSELAEGPRAGEALRTRLYLVGIRGYEKAFARVRDVLESGLQLTSASETLDDEVRARTGSSPAGLSSDAAAELAPDLPADRAAVAVSMRLLHVIEANLPGTLADLDSEFLHDLRVAVRRTRALQRELKSVFPADQLAHFRGEFKWLQQITGPSRDLDVYLLEFDEFVATVSEAHRHDLDVLRSVLEERHGAERREMEHALRSARAGGVLRDWAEFLDGLPALPVDDRPQAVTPVGDVAAERIERVYRKMVRMGSAIDDASPHEALHDLRKKGKELRYLLEFFAPLFPRKVTKPMVRTLKSLQDTLGRFQDREVQRAMIRGLGDEVAGRPGGAEALMAMGILVERLGQQQDAARSEFSERFAAFSSREQRQLVKKTFR